MAKYLTKICKECNLEKSVDLFSIRKENKDGYRNICKQCNSDKSINYYYKNKDVIKINRKKWSENNTDKLKTNLENFLKRNPNYQKEYAINNRDKINKRNKQRREIDIIFKIKENVRTLIKNSLKYKDIKKKQKSVNILGCSGQEFRHHLEAQFEPWMNWDNYGNPKDGIFELNKTWDIDHIIPLDTAITEDDVIRLNHYSNLQPICSYYNRWIKRNKILI